MKNFKINLKKTLILTFALALVPWTAVRAEPTILVDPYDNIPKVGTTQLHIVGAGLTPGRSIAIRQVSIAPYSAAEGDVGTGVKVENMHRGVLPVDASGVMDGWISVTYDPRVAGPVNIDYCDTISSLQRLCLLEFLYNATDTEPSELMLQQKLYFGMAGPVVTPPPATVPVTKDDCKDDKWFNFSTLGFKNQGACVSYVASKQ